MSETPGEYRIKKHQKYGNPPISRLGEFPHGGKSCSTNSNYGFIFSLVADSHVLCVVDCVPFGASSQGLTQVSPKKKEQIRQQTSQKLLSCDQHQKSIPKKSFKYTQKLERMGRTDDISTP